MASTDQFDILLQFQQTVIQDLQHRIINAAPLTTLWVKSPLSRRIEQAVPSLEVKACWNKPDVTVSDGVVELSAELNGGARQVLSGRILTLDGTVSARQAVTIVVDANQRLYTCVKEPTPVQVDMSQLKVSYEGSRWPEQLAAFNPIKEVTTLRPVLAIELFGPLSRIPLTCMPCSLPLSVPDAHGVVAAGTLSIKRVLSNLFESPASVALGLMLDEKRTASSITVSVIPSKSPYNAAIALSENGLNALLSHLCTQGKASGQVHHTRFGVIEWRWDKLHVTLRQGVLAISGLLVQQGVKLSVVAEMKSRLVNNGCVQSHIVSSNLDTNSAETMLASWNRMLTILLRSRATNSQNQDVRDGERLFQCFAIPASTQTIESVARELLVTDKQLVLYYVIPTSEEEVPLEIPPPKPTVSITQPRIPQQMTQGTSVSIELDAQILKDSTPPYDYAWTNDLSPNPVPHFGSTFTITSIPLVVGYGGGPQTLTTAHLKVIDMFGQVAETQAPAKYLPSTQQQKLQAEGSHPYTPSLSAPRGRSGFFPKWLIITLIVVASVLALSSMAALQRHPQDGGSVGVTSPSSCAGSTTGTETDLTFSFSGAAPSHMCVVSPGACNATPNMWTFHVLGTVNGMKYTLFIGIILGATGQNNPTPDTYSTYVALNTGDHIYPDPSVPGWSTTRTGGTVTVYNGGRSGRVDAHMNNHNNTSGTVNVTGKWACS